jgi:hypothetical protein
VRMTRAAGLCGLHRYTSMLVANANRRYQQIRCRGALEFSKSPMRSKETISVVTTAAAIASTLVNAYCVVGEFGFPAGFGAELVAGPTWTASQLCNVSGGLSITWSYADRPAVTSTVSPNSRPSWMALRAALPPPPRMATWEPSACQFGFTSEAGAKSRPQLNLLGL